jgi:hypothetical protein
LFSLAQLAVFLLSALLHYLLQEYLPYEVLLCLRQSNLHDPAVKYDNNFEDIEAYNTEQIIVR